MVYAHATVKWNAPNFKMKIIKIILRKKCLLRYIVGDFRHVTIEMENLGTGVTAEQFAPIPTDGAPLFVVLGFHRVLRMTEVRAG